MPSPHIGSSLVCLVLCGNLGLGLLARPQDLFLPTWCYFIVTIPQGSLVSRACRPVPWMALRAWFSGFRSSILLFEAF